MRSSISSKQSGTAEWPTGGFFKRSSSMAKSFNQVFFQDLRCPLAELCSTLRTNSVAQQTEWHRDCSGRSREILGEYLPIELSGISGWLRFVQAHLRCRYWLDAHWLCERLYHKAQPLQPEKATTCQGLKTTLNAGLTVSTGEKNKLTLRSLGYVICHKSTCYSIFTWLIIGGDQSRDDTYDKQSDRCWSSMFATLCRLRLRRWLWVPYRCATPLLVVERTLGLAVFDALKDTFNFVITSM